MKITNEANQRVLILPVASLQSHPSASLTSPDNDQTACLRLMKYISKRSKRMEHTSCNSLPSCINIRLQSRFSFRDQINSFSPYFHCFFFGSFSFFFLKIGRHKSSRDEANVFPPICINECMNMIIKSWTFSRTGCRVPRVCAKLALRFSFAISMLHAHRYPDINFKYGSAKLIEVI